MVSSMDEEGNNRSHIQPQGSKEDGENLSQRSTYSTFRSTPPESVLASVLSTPPDDVVQRKSPEEMQVGKIMSEMANGEDSMNSEISGLTCAPLFPNGLYFYPPQGCYGQSSVMQTAPVYRDDPRSPTIGASLCSPSLPIERNDGIKSEFPRSKLELDVKVQQLSSVLNTSSTFVFADRLNKLFIMPTFPPTPAGDEKCCLFHISTNWFQPGCQLRAKVVFTTDPNDNTSIVSRCHIHHANEIAYIDSNSETARHVVRIKGNHVGRLDMDPNTMQRSVVVPFQTQQMSVELYFTCNSSCQHRKKKTKEDNAKSLVFTLENVASGDVLARHKMSLRVCSVPSRDCSGELPRSDNGSLNNSTARTLPDMDGWYQTKTSWVQFKTKDARLFAAMTHHLNAYQAFFNEPQRNSPTAQGLPQVAMLQGLQAESSDDVSPSHAKRRVHQQQAPKKRKSAGRAVEPQKRRGDRVSVSEYSEQVALEDEDEVRTFRDDADEDHAD